MSEDNRHDPDIHTKIAEGAITSDPNEPIESGSTEGGPNLTELKKEYITHQFKKGHLFRQGFAELTDGAGQMQDESQAEQLAYAIKPDMDRASDLRKEIVERTKKDLPENQQDVSDDQIQMPALNPDGRKFEEGSLEALELKRQAAILDGDMNMGRAQQVPEEIPELQNRAKPE